MILIIYVNEFSTKMFYQLFYHFLPKNRLEAIDYLHGSNKTTCLESNEISFLLKSVRFWNIQLLLNVKFLNIWMFFFFVFWQITASCCCISTNVAFVWFLTSMNVFMLIQLATKLGMSILSTKSWSWVIIEKLVDTPASAESFTTHFTAIGTIICVTLSMNFKIFLQVSGVRTFGTFEDLGFVSMNSLIVLIQSRLLVRF